MFEYRAYTDLFNHLLDWKELENLEFDNWDDLFYLEDVIEMRVIDFHGRNVEKFT